MNSQCNYILLLVPGKIQTTHVLEARFGQYQHNEWLNYLFKPTSCLYIGGLHL